MQTYQPVNLSLVGLRFTVMPSPHTPQVQDSMPGYCLIYSG